MAKLLTQLQFTIFGSASNKTKTASLELESCLNLTFNFCFVCLIYEKLKFTSNIDFVLSEHITISIMLVLSHDRNKFRSTKRAFEAQQTCFIGSIN